MLSYENQKMGARNGGIYEKYSGGYGEPKINFMTLQQRETKAEAPFKGIKYTKPNGGILLKKYFNKLNKKK